MGLLNANAERWVAALRSGEFQQARDQLRQGDRFCCLGVACELHRRAVGGKWDTDEHASDYLHHSGSLPDVVRDWIGLREETGMFDDGLTSLSNLNDNGSTFEEIADVIERRAGGLFV